MNYNKLYKIAKKNSVISCNSAKSIAVKKNHVNLNYWFNPNSKFQNVGDLLSPYVVQSTAHVYGIDVEKKVSKTKHLYAIGSILPGYQDATVWGSGLMFDNTSNSNFNLIAFFHRTYHKLDIRAVRGPETRRILLKMGFSCPEIYGDPGVLMPRFYKPIVRSKLDYVIVPHHSKYSYFKEQKNVLNPITDDWEDFINKLCSANLVISSSLHGIILAEAYGIPAIMLSMTPDKDITKYKDWYYSTGRNEFPIVQSLEEALSIRPAALPTLTKMQKNLIESFPYEMWEE